MSVPGFFAAGLPGLSLANDKVRDIVFGKGPSTENIDLLTGGQQDLLNFIIQQAMSGQGGFGFDEDFFNQNFVEPALRQFESRTAPSIQQKFIAAGAGRGSSLEDALTRAGADVQGSLDQQRAQLLNQALNRQLQAAGLGLGTQAFGVQVNPAETGLFQEVASGFGQAFGGGIGQKTGEAFGSAINKGFRR